MLSAAIGAAGSLIGGYFDRKSSEKTAEKNIAMQKEFAQRGIQWKVSDAKKAGVHPLYALGANTHSFAPVSVGSTNFADVGQDLGRAAGAAMSKDQRTETTAIAASKLAIERGGLENELLRAQIRNLNNKSQVPPGMVANPIIPGQAKAAPSAAPWTFMGQEISPTPGRYSETQHVTDQVGEMGDIVHGPFVFHNALSNFTNKHIYSKLWAKGRTTQRPYPHD